MNLKLSDKSALLIKLSCVFCIVERRIHALKIDWVSTVVMTWSGKRFFDQFPLPPSEDLQFLGSSFIFPVTKSLYHRRIV
jgi:hypothetical protein